MDVLENEQELEYVLAHEIAHVEQRHGLQFFNEKKQKSQFQKLGNLGLLLITKNNRFLDVYRCLANVARKIVLKGYSWKYEIESDEYALFYYYRNNLNPSGIFSVLNKLSDLGSKNKSSLFATHPIVQNRLMLAESVFGREDASVATFRGTVRRKVFCEIALFPPVFTIEKPDSVTDGQQKNRNLKIMAFVKILNPGFSLFQNSLRFRFS